MSERTITKELLTQMASQILQELGLNGWTVFSVFPQPMNEALPPVGSATIDEIAPVWWIDFLSDDSKPFRVSITDKPGLTDKIVRNEIIRRLHEHTSSTS
jgi:hypothetical protein